MAEPGTKTASGGRRAQLLMAGVLAVAMAGYFVEVTRTTSPPELRERSATGDIAPVQPALSYAELSKSQFGPNRDWGTRLSSLRQQLGGLFDDVVLDPAAKAASLAKRQGRRAYNGAPPVVPHAIDQLSTDACLACHEIGLQVESRTTAIMPHPFLTNCTQCHVSNALATETAIFPNSFAGKPAPFEGPRAWSGAPPVMPHTSLMRDNCLACHGPGGPNGMRTTHPWRQSCTQCHAPSAKLSQHLIGPSRFLDPLPIDRRSSEQP